MFVVILSCSLLYYKYNKENVSGNRASLLLRMKPTDGEFKSVAALSSRQEKTKANERCPPPRLWVFAVVVKSSHDVVRGKNVILFLYFDVAKMDPLFPKKAKDQKIVEIDRLVDIKAQTKEKIDSRLWETNVPSTWKVTVEHDGDL
jgi:hypothetical protein